MVGAMLSNTHGPTHRQFALTLEHVGCACVCGGGGLRVCMCVVVGVYVCMCVVVVVVTVMVAIFVRRELSSPHQR